MTTKQKLHYLLEAYKCENYDTATFCDQLTSILYYENNGINELNGNEKECFDTLGQIAERHSPFEADHKNYPNVYRTNEEVRAAFERAYLLLSRP